MAADRKPSAVSYWLRFWWLLFGIKLRGDFGYHHQTHTIINLAIMIFGYFMQFVAIWVLVDRFQSINGWTTYQVLFLYALNLFTYAAGGVFAQCFWRLETVITTGELDDILLKPMNPFAVYLTLGIAVQYSAHMAIASFFVILSLVKLGITVTLGNALRLVGAVAGLSLIQAGLTIAVAATASWTKSTRPVGFVIQGIRQFIRYPVSIYPKAVQAVLTFVVPYAFVNFYPAYVLFGRSEPLAFAATFPWLPLAVG
jgi:ABC-2 type transport system permease protein